MIGVAAVIAMLAIGAGAQASITSSIKGIGTNLIFVIGQQPDVRNPKPLTTARRARRLQANVLHGGGRLAPCCKAASQVTFSGESNSTTVMAVGAGYMPRAQPEP